MMPRHVWAPPVGCVSGVQGLAAGKRQAPAGLASRRPGGHRRPRGIGGTHPGRISLVRNVETPSGSGRSCSGRWADREEGRIPRREQDGQEANAGGRKAAGNRDTMGGPSAGGPG